jgi:hypothetical protein
LCDVVGAERSGVGDRLLRVAGAWGTVYLVLSLVPLAFLIAAGHGWPTERSTVISVTDNDGSQYDGFGLTYQGFGGGLLLWSELLLVVAALMVSVRGGRFARVAHAGLLAWALFLALNFWWVIGAGDYLPIAWMLPIVTVGAVLVLVRWWQASGLRAPTGRDAHSS